MKPLKELEKNKKLISESYYDDKDNLIREVDGCKIIQIEEKTAEDVRTNYLINLWRMRNK